MVAKRSKKNVTNPVDVAVHDSSQIEIKTVHKIPEAVPTKGVISFTQDIFIFLPKSLGSRSDSYSKEEFYRSLTNYIRIKTPRVLGDEEKHTCRVDRILPTVYKIAEKQVFPELESVAIDEIRLFGAYFNDQLKLLAKEVEPHHAISFFEDLVGLLKAYRALMDRSEKILIDASWLQACDAFRYVDEFLSNRLEEDIILFSKKGIDCLRFLSNEFIRREEKKYITVIDNVTHEVNNESKREIFVFRMGRFKKYISEILYLEVVRERHDRLFMNLAAVVGAAVAAFLNALADPNLRTSMTGDFFAKIRHSIPMMLTFVVAVYVFKDRIKDTLRQSLLVWLKPWLPDYSFYIRNKQNQVIGECKEDAKFMGSSDLDDETKRIRQDQTEIILPSDSFEDVIFYRRRLKLRKEVLESMFRNTDSIKDIIRFDFHPFLMKMSNAVQVDEFLTVGGEVKEVSLPRVYHVNIIVRHQVTTKESGEHSAHYSRVRVILDRSGIKRVEHVDVPGTEPVEIAEAKKAA